MGELGFGRVGDGGDGSKGLRERERTKLVSSPSLFSPPPQTLYSPGLRNADRIIARSSRDE